MRTFESLGVIPLWPHHEKKLQNGQVLIDGVLEVLDAWMSDFIAIAKIALGGAQLSKALGMLEHS